MVTVVLPMQFAGSEGVIKKSYMCQYSLSLVKHDYDYDYTFVILSDYDYDYNYTKRCNRLQL